MTDIRKPALLPLLLIGLAGGILSGLFGIGGGVIIVPALVLLVRMPQRLAAGTSVAAILPAAIVGATTYATQGNVDWLAAVLLAIGIIAGSQLGAFLLSRLSVPVLQWFFLAFLLVIIVSLWFVVPQRESEIGISALSVVLLIVTGLGTGILSGLLGVGGGIVVVPILMFFFGASDLVAKGTSLLMMIPGSVSGSIANARRHNVDFRMAAAVGIAAAVTSPLGALAARALPPVWANILFSIFLAGIFAQYLVQRIRARRGGRRGA